MLRYLGRTTGYSRQQLTRLLRWCLATGGLTKRYRPPAQGFARKYTVADVALLAETERPPRHALGTRHPALDAARFVGLRGHPHCAAGQERRRGAQVLRRQPSRSVMQCKSTPSAPHTSTLNFHRPCLFAEDTMGKVKKRGTIQSCALAA